MSGESHSIHHCLSFASLGVGKKFFPVKKLAERSGHSLLRDHAGAVGWGRVNLPAPIFPFCLAQKGPLQEGSQVLKRVYSCVWFLMS